MFGITSFSRSFAVKHLRSERVRTALLHKSDPKTYYFSPTKYFPYQKIDSLMPTKVSNPIDSARGFAYLKIVLAVIEYNEVVYKTTELRCVIDTAAEKTHLRKDLFTAFKPHKHVYQLKQERLGDNLKNLRDIYWAHFKIVGIEMNWIKFDLVKEEALPMDVDVVLSTPELKHFLFTYNGKEQCFELEFLKDKV